MKRLRNFRTIVGILCALALIATDWLAQARMLNVVGGGTPVAASCPADVYSDTFSDGNYSSNPTWTIGGEAYFSVVSNALVMTSGGENASYAYLLANAGQSVFTLYVTVTPSGTWAANDRNTFIRWDDTEIQEGGISFKTDASGNITGIRIYQIDDGSSYRFQDTTASFSFSSAYDILVQYTGATAAGANNGRIDLFYRASGGSWSTATALTGLDTDNGTLRRIALGQATEYAGASVVITYDNFSYKEATCDKANY